MKGFVVSDRESVLIVEQRSSGHLLVFVRELVEEAVRLQMQPIVALGPGVINSIEFSAHLAGAPARFVSFEGAVTPRLIDSLSVEHDVARVVVPHGDELAARQPFSRWGYAGETTVLVMRDPAWELSDTRGARRIRLLLKMLMLRMLAARPGVRVVWLRSYGYHGRRDHVIDPFISDVAPKRIREERPRVRSSLGLSDDTFWFLVTGAITTRKNIDAILEGLSAVRASHPEREIGLAVVGPITQRRDEVLSQIERARASGAHVILHERHMQNSEMNEVVASADAVVMAYSSNSPNSTMLKAKVLGVPIVVAGPSSVRGFARDMGLEFVGTLEDLVPLMTSAVALSAVSDTLDDPPSGSEFARVLLQSRQLP